MSVVTQIKEATVKAISHLYGINLQSREILVNATKPEFEGDYTVVLFAFVKQLKKSPDALGQELGDTILALNPDLFTSYNVIKGFLNLSIADSYWLQFVNSEYADPLFGYATPNGQRVMVEYSSPNTNKPLHLGHLRNNFLGRSIE
jgi:arginyl-tRNA synthetase